MTCPIWQRTTKSRAANGRAPLAHGVVTRIEHSPGDEELLTHSYRIRPVLVPVPIVAHRSFVSRDIHHELDSCKYFVCSQEIPTRTRPTRASKTEKKNAAVSRMLPRAPGPRSAFAATQTGPHSSMGNIQDIDAYGSAFITVLTGRLRIDRGRWDGGSPDHHGRFARPRSIRKTPRI